MRNAYALCSGSGLHAISDWLAPGARVSQAFCSALPVGYSNVPQQEWRDFAMLILEAAYEATLLAGALQAMHGWANIVLLTLRGGGAFGNRRKRLFAAIRRELERVCGFGLDVHIVSYAKPDLELIEFVDSL
jgi:hypothetical protein